MPDARTVAPYHTSFLVESHQLVDCHEEHIMRIVGIVVMLGVTLRFGDVWARRRRIFFVNHAHGLTRKAAPVRY